MSEQAMKILKMLEEGKLTVEEASELLSKVQELEEKEEASGPEPKPGPQHRPDFHFHSPPGPNVPGMPPMPDVSRIVNDAMAQANAAMAKAYEKLGRLNITMGEEGESMGPLTYKGARFSGAVLEHTDLTEAQMDSRTRFEGANLGHASFVDADLRGADLRGADLSHSDFTDAKFSNADMRGARLSKGNYVDADFSNADLKGADLSMSILTDADFRNVKEPGLILRGMTMVGLKYHGTPEGEEAPGAESAEEREAAAKEAAAYTEAQEAKAEEAAARAEAWEAEADEAAARAEAQEAEQSETHGADIDEERNWGEG